MDKKEKYFELKQISEELDCDPKEVINRVENLKKEIEKKKAKVEEIEEKLKKFY